MATATTTCSEAADLMARIASRMGPYTRRGQVEVAGQRLGLSPTQARRLAYREWKQVPAHVMDRLRALYNETCEALDESARQKIGALDASSQKRRGKLHPVDGDGDGLADRPADHGRQSDDAADPRVNDRVRPA